MQFSDEQRQEDYSLILNSPYFDKEWYDSNYDFEDDLDSVSHYLNIGYTLGFNPGPSNE